VCKEFYEYSGSVIVIVIQARPIRAHLSKAARLEIK
jgi:hypothetical protein